MKWTSYFLAAVMALGLAVSASAGIFSGSSEDENLLRDSSFEEGEPGTFSKAWTPFGKAFPEEITARSGSHAVKLFGNFDREDNYSGVFQDVPAKPGKEYEASIFVRSNEDDFMMQGAKSWVKLEFYDKDGNLLEQYESLDQVSDTSSAGEYQKLTTGAVPAPPGTRIARFVYIFHQQDVAASGSTFGDDPMLKIASK